LRPEKDLDAREQRWVAFVAEQGWVAEPLLQVEQHWQVE